MRRNLSLLLSLSLFLTVLPEGLWATQNTSTTPPTSAQGPGYPTKTPEQLQQLVAPVALYPDPLLAQVLGASTLPVKVVEADRWLQAHANLKGDALAKAVDQQPWDPSIKGLTAFPSVLDYLDKNLSWTAALGDAYYDQPKDVTEAVQVMRQKAQQAGNLKTTSQQVVTTEGSTIVIEPASTEVVYVPEYNSTVVYVEGSSSSSDSGEAFAAGVAVGVLAGYEWGWASWGYSWGGYRYGYGYGVQINCSGSNSCSGNGNYNRIGNGDRNYNRNGNYNRSGNGNGDRNGNRNGNLNGNRDGNRNGNGSSGETASRENNQRQESPRSSGGDTGAGRGYGDPRGQSNTHTGGFSNYGHGAEKAYSQRGSSSLGGGGFPRGGGFPGGGPPGGGGFPGGGPPGGGGFPGGPPPGGPPHP